MNVPENLKYTEDHEWAKIEGDVAIVGITDYAQGELGDVVFVELPEVGATVSKGDTFGTIEAVKAVADLFAPLSGEIIEVNEKLGAEPETINKDPYGEGWMVKIKLSDPGEVNDLMDAETYKEKIS
ncbi:glycine cleavage system protein GcvH [Caldithrix abyssi]|uniref:Glycine cleavage system H protein n=1 Tax=Caldithrix abyssi DSM 13497 TaxID=880073 RepID=H1XV11_CALAY|nr:glycine cleavage system protein GcvH [Caldithrix abyssi]APF18881.1 gcvH glycine cleavage system H protein [Caldithrix abyssi DSM 13497]EHO42844.1 Glycine cleavage system H protein [Caldithrix abyssi DSM 13497]